MNDDPQIVAGDAELPTDIVFGLVVQKGSEDRLVALRELPQKPADKGTVLLADGYSFDIDYFVLNLKMAGFEGDIPSTGAVMLKENVIADRIHEGSKTIGLPDAILGTDRTEDAHERLLAEVVDGIGREPTGTKL